MGWFDERFKEHPQRIRFDCLHCGRGMWFPKCKAGKYKTCGGECSAARYAAMTDARPQTQPQAPPRRWACAQCSSPQLGGKAKGKFCGKDCWREFRAQNKETLAADRTRACKHCGSSFTVKKSQIDEGQGSYCSMKCAYASGALAHISSPENLAVAAERRKQLIQSGRIVYAKGQAHHSWVHDREALRSRQKEVRRNQCLKYRKDNPHKVREFTARRKHRVLGRLPRGTIPKIGALQRWRCAICSVSVRHKYHVDHIAPLARGGTHEPLNIQLLCPSCNVRKSAKDPITYMQERGFLL